MIRERRGFTIVELLIVVVVIGVLASITVVAYNGLQQRAKSAAYVSALAQWERLLKSYKVIAGDYPSTGAFEVCLSASFPAGDGHAADQCYSQVPTYNINVSPSFNSALSSQMGQLPVTVLPTVRTLDNANGSTGVIRGLTYGYNQGVSTAVIQYFLDKGTSGGTKCIGSDSVEYTNYQDGNVRCRRALP